MKSRLKLYLPTLIGDPGNLFLVNTAAHESVGSSRTITVPLIGNALIAGASTGINVPEAVPHRNPFGNDPHSSKYLRYSSILENSGNSPGPVLKNSEESVALLAVRFNKENDFT